jgi:hypothetical protein
MSKSENKYIPKKTLSAIIYQHGKPILELPVITLQSPHDVFIHLRDAGLAPDLIPLWNFNKKAKGETERRLKNIMDAIDKHPQSHVGYYNLKKLINLWLFTSNGFQRIKGLNNEKWNLHEYGKNVGNLYITYKESDNGKFDYKGEWQTLQEFERPDRYVSPVLMNLNDTAVDPITGKTIKLFRKGTPYIFLSDSPSITNAEAAAA